MGNDLLGRFHSECTCVSAFSHETEEISKGMFLLAHLNLPASKVSWGILSSESSSLYCGLSGFDGSRDSEVGVERPGPPRVGLGLGEKIFLYPAARADWLKNLYIKLETLSVGE